MKKWGKKDQFGVCKTPRNLSQFKWRSVSGCLISKVVHPQLTSDIAYEYLVAYARRAPIAGMWNHDPTPLVYAHDTAVSMLKSTFLTGGARGTGCPRRSTLTASPSPPILLRSLRFIVLIACYGIFTVS